MKFLSICSGIDAASMAWCGALGWTCLAFSEIEAFPSAVLAHHWPDVPNLGNLEHFEEWPESLLAEVDLLAGGTPCQGFSFSGLRGSLDDARGQLTLIYAKLVARIDRIRARHGRPPVICVWENVPGVLSTKDNAFGCFLGALAGEDIPLTPPGGRWSDAGYVRGPARAIAWRLLDAQYFGVAQRRERVFALAGAGAFRPEEILFEFEGVRRDSPPSRQAGEGVAPTLSARTKGGGGLATDFDLDGGLIPEIAPTAFQVSGNCGAWETGEVTGALDTATDRTSNVVVFDTTQITHPKNRSNHQPGDPCHPLSAGAHAPAVAFNLRGREGGAMPQVDPDGLACQRAASGGSSRSYLATPNAVRRLTPRECARLQGFPDEHAAIPWRGKPAGQCPDGPQYKAYGNSWAVPCARWIGERIQAWMEVAA